MAQKDRQSKRQGKKEKQDTQSGERKSRTATANRESDTGLARREPVSPAHLTASPFSLIRRFTEEMDRLFGDFGSGRGLAPTFRELGRLADLEGPMWSPQVEVFERGGKLIVHADLPGLTKDDIKVDVNDDAIRIRGERRQEQEESKEGYYRSERSYGSFYREIPLPGGVKAEEANATFRNGVLEITLPAPERQPRSRSIEIGEGSEPEQQPRARTKAAGR